MNDFCILDQFSSTPVMDYINNSKQKYDWQHLTRSILPVWNSFIWNLFTTKSNECKSVFLNGQACGVGSCKQGHTAQRNTRRRSRRWGYDMGGCLLIQLGCVS